MKKKLYCEVLGSFFSAILFLQLLHLNGLSLTWEPQNWQWGDEPLGVPFSGFPKDQPAWKKPKPSAKLRKKPTLSGSQTRSLTSSGNTSAWREPRPEVFGKMDLFRSFSGFSMRFLRLGIYYTPGCTRPSRLDDWNHGFFQQELYVATKWQRSPCKSCACCSCSPSCPDRCESLQSTEAWLINMNLEMQCLKDGKIKSRI